MEILGIPWNFKLHLLRVILILGEGLSYGNPRNSLEFQASLVKG